MLTVAVILLREILAAATLYLGFTLAGRARQFQQQEMSRLSHVGQICTFSLDFPP